jgi:hypothetical protein
MMMASISTVPSMAGITIFKSGDGFDEAAAVEGRLAIGLTGPSVQFDWHPFLDEQLPMISNAPAFFDTRMDSHTMIQEIRRIWSPVSIWARKSTGRDRLPVHTAAYSTKCWITECSSIILAALAAGCKERFSGCDKERQDQERCLLSMHEGDESE